jgi:lactate dehydrogenase-like 2-hydroxyacid dehydrogenase
MISDPRMGFIEPSLKAEGWRVVKGWELDAAARGEVGAIAHAGGFPLPAAMIEGLPKLGLIACMGAGYDGLDIGWLRARGIEVTNAAGLNAEDVADHAIGLMLAGWRNILVGDQILRADGWRGRARLPESLSLKGRRFGVVGLGQIGAASARRAEAFGLEVAWWGPRPKPEAPWPRLDSLMALAEWSDILLVASRASADNEKMISREVIEAIGPEGMIVNVARGSVVDEDALIAALKEGRLGLAGLDVFAEEPTPPARWEGVPNTVLTPHTGSTTKDMVSRLIAQMVVNMRLHLAGRPVANPVPAGT